MRNFAPRLCSAREITAPLRSVSVQRVRCATLGRLDEIKTAKEVEQKTLRIPWQDPSRPKSNRREFRFSRRAMTRFGIDADQPMHSKNGTDDDETSTPLFQRRTEPRQPLVQPSPLTALLQSGNLNQNPFAQYAKFDGTVSEPTPAVRAHHAQALPVRSRISVPINRSDSSFTSNLRNCKRSLLLSRPWKKQSVLFVTNTPPKTASPL